MKVLIVTYYRYPNGDAGAVRQHNLAKLYKRIGHDVTIIGMGFSRLNEMKIYEEIKYTSFRYSNENRLSRVKNIIFFINNLKTFLSRENDSFDVIHIASTNPQILLWLKYYTRKRSILLIHDSVEWYSANQFALRILSPSYIMKNIANKYLVDRNFKVIAISRFLQQYFDKKGVETIRIPIVFDTVDMSENQSFNNKLVISYAGSPGKKDYLDVMLKGISALDKRHMEQIEFRIFGVDEKVIKRMFGLNLSGYMKIQKSLKIFGRVSRDKVIESLRDSDFSVMLRDSNARYAKAGFPTKIVESLSCGTPVITNISSDLGEYLTDLVNSIIVKECNSSSFSEAIKKALSLNTEMIKNMKMNAYNTSLTYFNIDLYQRDLKFLLNQKKYNLQEADYD